MLLILPFGAIETWLTPVFPTTHAFVDDWANHGHRFLIFLVGFFVAKDPTFWRTVDRVWLVGPVLAATAFLVLMHGQAVVDALRQFLPASAASFVFSYVKIIYAWSCILTLLGFGQRVLNRQSRVLRYLTSAIFCYYVLHQTITVVAGYYLTQMRLGAVAEGCALAIITIGGCVAGYEILRRIPGVGILFGVRQVSGFR
jgi:surface polysaccharide O-acyltransferase-like enzyme